MNDLNFDLVYIKDVLMLPHDHIVIDNQIHRTIFISYFLTIDMTYVVIFSIWQTYTCFVSKL